MSQLLRRCVRRRQWQRIQKVLEIRVAVRLLRVAICSKVWTQAVFLLPVVWDSVAICILRRLPAFERRPAADCALAVNAAVDLVFQTGVDVRVCGPAPALAIASGQAFAEDCVVGRSLADTISLVSLNVYCVAIGISS